MRKLFLINESEKQRVLNLHKYSTKKQYLNTTILEDILSDERVGAEKWIDENNVVLSTWVFPNPLKVGEDLKIGVKSSIDFPELSQNNDPNNPPYHYYRDWIMHNTDKLIIRNMANQVIVDEEINSSENISLGNDFDIKEDDGYYISYPSDSDVVQKILKQKQVIVQFFTNNMSNALETKLKFRPFRLVIEGNM